MFMIAAVISHLLVFWEEEGPQPKCFAKEVFEIILFLAENFPGFLLCCCYVTCCLPARAEQSIMQFLGRKMLTL